MSTLKVDTIQNTNGDPIDLDVSSLNRGQLAGFRNQIINGDFRVNQRNNGGYNNPGPTVKYENVDRWGIRGLSDGNHLAQSNNVPAGFDYSVTIDGQTDAAIRQRIELVNQKPGPFVSGSQWTLSVWANNQIRARVQDSDVNVSLPIGDMTATSETSNGFTRYVETFTMTADASTDYLEVALQNQNGVLMRVAGVQLEPGPVATPFEHRPIGTELALCQRYYQTEYVEGRRGSGFFHDESTKFSDQLRGRWHFCQEMRTAPTVALTPVFGDGIYAGWTPTVNDGFNDNITTRSVPVKAGDFTYTSAGGNGGTFRLTMTADAEL